MGISDVVSKGLLGIGKQIFAGRLRREDSVITGGPNRSLFISSSAKISPLFNNKLPKWGKSLVDGSGLTSTPRRIRRNR